MSMTNVLPLRDPQEPQETRTKTIDDYPLILQAKHVQEILGVSTAFTYEVLNSAKCPTMRIGAKRMIVNRDSFFRFLRESEGHNLL